MSCLGKKWLRILYIPFRDRSPYQNRKFRANIIKGKVKEKLGSRLTDFCTIGAHKKKGVTESKSPFPLVQIKKTGYSVLDGQDSGHIGKRINGGTCALLAAKGSETKNIGKKDYSVPIDYFILLNYNSQ
jgi:hypothetical protein